MDPSFLQAAARSTWGTGLSPLLENQASKSAIVERDVKLSSNTRTSTLSVSVRSLSCPKCRTVWIPGLNVQARVRRQDGKGTTTETCSLVNKNLDHVQRSTRHSKNKRAKSRAKNRRIKDSQHSNVKLKSKSDPSKSKKRSNLEFMYYKCSNACSGNLIMPLQSITENNRKKDSLMEQKSQQTSQIEPEPKSFSPRDARNLPGGAKKDEGPAKKKGKLNLSDFML